MDFAAITKQTSDAIRELLEVSRLEKGDVFIVGCSTSEVMGEHTGKGSSMDAAKAVYDGIYTRAARAGHFPRRTVLRTSESCGHRGAQRVAARDRDLQCSSQTPCGRRFCDDGL